MALVQQGTDRLIGKLRRLKGAEAKAVLRKGCRAGAKVMAAAIKKSLPRRSGRAQKSVKVRAMKRSRKRVGMRVVVDAKTDPGKEGQPGIPYSQFGEYGTGHEAAKDWQHKAVASSGTAALATATATMATGIEDLAKQ